MKSKSKKKMSEVQRKWLYANVSIDLKIPRAWRDALAKIAAANERKIAAEVRLCIKKHYGFERG